jgi:hypothetical protein
MKRALPVAAALLLLFVAGCGGSHTSPWFHTHKAGFVSCEFVQGSGAAGTYARCITQKPWMTITMAKDGSIRACPACRTAPPATSTDLRPGHSMHSGPFRCTPLATAMRCRGPKGHSFVIGPGRLKEFTGN